MIGKIHDVSGNKIFASCDKSLVGKTIITEDFEIYFSESFYGDRLLSKEEILKYIDGCHSANIFGEKICNLLLEEKIIVKESIIYIEKIPHVQIYKV
ncbi:MAG: DUF424 family protein [Candidatus ainarchaeum sp.]|nr:DUF424 family protein [Candidatus ainarchaeum sp.]